MCNQKIRFSWWAAAAMLSGLFAAGVGAQPPDSSSGTGQVCQRKGLLHRWVCHSAHTLQDKWIGYPDNFIEPPLGHYIREQFTIEVAKADPHRFTLYRSDFLPGTDRFSPTGAARFNLMYSRTAAWPGPILVEWTPDEPGLAEARRQAVLATYQRAGRPLVPERVVVGPSPYPGGMGAEAAQNFNSVLVRSLQAELSYPPSPQSAAYSYSGGGGQ
jgi:hypothetical protein